MGFHLQNERINLQRSAALVNNEPIHLVLLDVKSGFLGDLLDAKHISVFDARLPGLGVKQNQMSWPNVERGETNCIIYLLVQGEMVVRVLWQCKLLPVWYKWYVGPNQKPWLICCCLQIGTPTERVAN